MASPAEQLRLAAERGDAEALKGLLQAGTSVTEDTEGRTALHLASANGHVSVVKVLLDSGASINARDTSGYSALHQAATEGHEEVVKLLLKRGCHVDTQDDLHGNTALHETAWKGFSRTLQLLCKYNAKLYIKNHGGFTPLHLCCQRGHNQCCRTLLLAACKPDIRNSYGDTPLHTSARYGHAGVLRILISAFCNVNETNKNGDTALHISCAMGRNKLTRVLLEAGADCKIQNNQGETPRDIAARKGFHEVAELLDNPPVTRIPVQHNQESTKKHHKDHSTTSQEGKKEKKKSKKSSKVHFSDGKKVTKCGNISPYGCHESPNPESFPSLKLMSLPQEPLKSGEQYYADLAGNIKKGPRGLGYTCYCAPFFHHVERKLDAQKKELLERLEGQGENLEAKIRGLEKRTKERLSGLDQRVKESLAAERGECAERIDRRLFRERCELEQRQERTTRALRSEMGAWSRGGTSAQSGLEPGHNIDIPIHNNGASFCSSKDYSKCGLPRSKSEDMLSDTQSHQNSISLVSGATSRFSAHGNLWNGSAATNRPDCSLRTGNSKHEQSGSVWNHWSQTRMNPGNPVSRLKMKCLGNFDLKCESRSEGDLTRCHIISEQDSELTNNNVNQNDMTVKASSKYPYSPESNNDVSDFNRTSHTRNIPLNKNIPPNMNISFKNTFSYKSKQPPVSKPTILHSTDNQDTSYINDSSHSMNIRSPYRTNHNHDQNHNSTLPLENNDGSSFV